MAKTLKIEVVTAEQVHVIRLGIIKGREDARSFVQEGRYISPYDHKEVSPGFRSLFNNAWYRTYDPIIARDED